MKVDGIGFIDKCDFFMNYFFKYMYKLIKWYFLLLINFLFFLKLSLGFNRFFFYFLNFVVICKKMVVSSRDYDI